MYPSFVCLFNGRAERLDGCRTTRSAAAVDARKNPRVKSMDRGRYYRIYRSFTLRVYSYRVSFRS
ncbi:MAG: hypothetical protein ACRD8O_00045 [Bryobacteraceae bacterium]